jgi:hypothetical protein
MQSVPSIPVSYPGDPSGNTRRRVDLAAVAAIGIAAVLAGVAGGILARFAMRLVALVLGLTPAFTVTGTMGIVFIFVLVALVVAVVYMLATAALPGNTRKRALIVCAALLTIMMSFFILVAGGEVPAEPPLTVALLILGFVPIPIGMGLVLVYGAAKLETQLARGGRPTITLGWLAAVVVASLGVLISVLALGEQYLRHPRLYSMWLSVVSDQYNLAAMQDRAMLIALFVVSLWLALAGVVLWNDARAGRSPLRSVSLLLLPLFTVLAVESAPMVFSWLGDSSWVAPLLQSLGIAMVLILLILAEPARPLPRWVAVLAASAWLLATLWLFLPALRTQSWSEWVVWATIALASASILLGRAQPGGRWKASTVLLAFFIGWWLLAWAAAMALPELALRGYSGYQASMSAPISWLPWLFLPAALWSESRQAQRSISLS